MVPVPRFAHSGDLAGSDLERGEQGGGAVPFGLTVVAVDNFEAVPDELEPPLMPCALHIWRWAHKPSHTIGQRGFGQRKQKFITQIVWFGMH